MADRYKEGRDFEWVPMKDKDGKIVKDGKGGSVKTRRFFTKAEKEAMKAKDKPKVKPKPKPKGKPSAPKSPPTRPQERPTEGQIRSSSGGRTRYTPSDFTQDGGPRRGSRKPKDSSEKNTNTSNETTLLRSSSSNPTTTTSRFPGITRIANAFSKLKDSLPASARADYSSNDEAMKLFNAFKREWRNLGPDAKRDLERVRRMFGWGFDEAGGGASARFNKGGMVKKGTRDYKKSGMFYKSGSPRGYK